MKYRVPYKRTIPTHVGRTCGHAIAVEVPTDHPHARGENLRSPGLDKPVAGPSPRTWGEHPNGVRPRCCTRTIPTHVGRTAVARSRTLDRADHPHARGENADRTDRTDWASGPSPRTWGEPHAQPGQASGSRTIPTHVGRTWGQAGRALDVPDHPHARGENDHETGFAFRFDGPSPRTWGEREQVSAQDQSARTIPTHVGRTPPAERAKLLDADHPHARGENSSSRPAPRAIPGPSPRTWGEPRANSEAH